MFRGVGLVDMASAITSDPAVMVVEGAWIAEPRTRTSGDVAPLDVSSHGLTNTRSRATVHTSSTRMRARRAIPR